MRKNEDMDRSTAGLSTEDLARPASTGVGAEREEAVQGAPVYPGESTPTPSGAGESLSGGTETESAVGTGTEGAVGTGTGGAVGTETEGAVGTESVATAAPADAGGAADTGGAGGANDDATPQLLTDDDERTFRDRWQSIQNKFVDDPREAVHDADTLVADVMQTLAATFAEHKKDLESQWSQGERVDTEELRGALRRYRSFFNRLLST